MATNRRLPASLILISSKYWNRHDNDIESIIGIMA
jgi:hypothetical protein